MKKTGAWLARYALEQLGVKQTFGIPGVHNTELYDELNSSEQITPVLVSHEGGAAFMADAVSRTSEQIGCLAIVPAAGVTHAASGIGEAFLDGVPMLIIAGGIRSDSAYGYQLHEVDQHSLLKPITKATFLIEAHRDIVPTLYRAYEIATSGEPGPVFVEIPVNIQLDKGQIDALQSYHQYLQNPGGHPVSSQSAATVTKAIPDRQQALDAAVKLLSQSQRPGIFVGWGARHAAHAIQQIAEHLGAPVATTLQGLSSFPANHPLHTGFSFGAHAVPASHEAFKDCDCLLAVGTRFAEIATGSYGIDVPENLIHIDINPAVFSRNYPARIAIQGDAASLLPELAERLTSTYEPVDSSDLRMQIARDKQAYRDSWYAHDTGGRVNPARFFDYLRNDLEDDAVIVLDDGNHTFLAAELMPVHSVGNLISPTDFNCMGYAVPASIGAKFANPDKTVVGIVGDGAFMMTCMELATAVSKQLGLAQFVFNDGDLSQIAQAQMRPYNRATCTNLPQLDYQALAQALGCEYVTINNDEQIQNGVIKALSLAREDKAVIVNVVIDYSKPTRFTEGVVKTNIQRLPVDTKVRMVGRALFRKVKKPS